MSIYLWTVNRLDNNNLYFSKNVKLLELEKYLRDNNAQKDADRIEEIITQLTNGSDIELLKKGSCNV